jgi:hypothetical protein
MPASLDSIRKTMDVQPTPQDKGLTMTVKVTAYDNGMISLDGRPINHFISDPDPQSHGWLGVTEVLVIQLGEFRRQVQTRQAEKVL